MRQPNDLPGVLLTLLVIFIILFVGTAALNQVAVSDADADRVSRTVLLDGTSTVQIDNTIGQDEAVYNSLGYAINLTGSNTSYFESDRPVELSSDDTWTMSVWARVDSAPSSNNMTALSANGRVIITYNGTAGNWSVWYYDEGSRNSYVVNASAPNQPGQFTNVMAWSNGTHLAIYRDNNLGETVNLSTTSVADAPVNSSNWDGRIDEVRIFDNALDASQRSSHVADPVAPLKATNRTARIMFDEPNRSTQRLFFTSADVLTYGETFSDGLSGELMDGQSFFNDLILATDYRWDVVGPKIKPVAGRQLDGAPVAYVEYEQKSELDTFADDWNRTMELIGVLAVVLPLSVIIGYLYMIRGGRR